MSVWRAFGFGLNQTIRHWRLWLPLYVANLAVSVLATLPVWLQLRALIGHRPWATTFMDHPVEFLIEAQGALGTTRLDTLGQYSLNWLPPVVVIAAVVLLTNSLAYAWLSGGVLESLAAGTFGGWSAFWSACRRWFWPFARLWVISLAALAVSLGLGAGLLSFLPPGSIWQIAGGFILLTVLVLGTNAIFEYARIGAVAHGDRGMLRATGRAYLFALRYLPQTLTLGVLLLGVAVFLAGFNFGVGQFIPGSFWGWGLAWQQVTVILGAGQKVLRLASQASLYATLSSVS